MERLLLQAQESAYRFSVMLCGHTDDTDDVMQDALLSTYRHVNPIREPEAFRARERLRALLAGTLITTPAPPATPARRRRTT